MKTKMLAAFWVCSGATMVLAGCGDDPPAHDADLGDEVDTRGDTVSDAIPDAAEESIGPDAIDGTTLDALDADDLADVPDGDIPGDATPEQRSILGVEESARFFIPGLTGPVHVVRTAGSIPHIYAANRNDLGRVLGFLMGRDRFFVTDLERRLGLGTISELLGALGLARDVESRQTGMVHMTERMMARLSPDTAAYLSAFADGMNAYIEAVRQDLLPPPTETQFAGLLGYDSAASMMKPFALRDVVALLTVFMQQSNFEAGDVGLAAAAERLVRLFDGATDEALRKSGYLDDVWNDVSALFPGTNSTEGFGVGKSRAHAAPKPARRAPHKGLPDGMAERLFQRIHTRMLALGRDREAGFGSNMWAVSGTHTADGSGLLANDGHLELSIPPFAYGTGVDTSVFGPPPEDGAPLAQRPLKQLGGWFASFPVLMGGTNGHVAFGGVNPVLDITDWYREELRLDAVGRPVQSLFKGEWRDLVATDETYIVADIPLLGSVGHSELWTRWTTFDARWITSIEGRRASGPEDAGVGETVVNVMGELVVPGDLDGDGVITAISFDYTGLDAARMADNLFELGLSTDVEEIREATRGFVGGGLFTAAADGGGSILYTSYQAVPCRAYLPRGEHAVFIAGADPTRIIDGTQYGGFEIPTDAAGKSDEAPGMSDPQKCVIPHAQMPYAIDPPSGIVFNANSDPAGLTDDGEERNDAYYIGGPWASTRANTIRRSLQRATAEGGATLDDMETIQANIDSRLGEVFVPYLALALDRAAAAGEGALTDLYQQHGARLDEARQWLDAWARRGYQAESGVETFYDTPSVDERADSVATMIFNAYIRRFLAGVWSDENINASRWGGEATVTATLRFLAGRGPDNPGELTSWNPVTEESVFFDVLGTEARETSDEVMVKALVDALAFLESEPSGPGLGGFGTPDMQAWLWGLRHQGRFESILASFAGTDPAIGLLTGGFEITTDRIPLMANLPQGDPRRDLKWFPRSGDQWGVDAANPGIGGGDFTHGSGPAFRLVVALKDGTVKGGFVLPGGQSGITTSPYFDDQLELWLGNQYMPLRFTPAEVAAGALGRELYLPAP